MSSNPTANNAGNGNISVGMNNSTVQTVISYTISDGIGGTASAQLVVTPGPKMPFGGAC